MMKEKSRIIHICEQFLPEGSVASCRLFGNGHINDTYRVICSDHAEEDGYVLQRVNTEVFRHPVQVMENVSLITSWLRKKVEEEGGDPAREVLRVILTKNGSPSFYYPEDDTYWRMYVFIGQATAYEQPENEQIFRESAVAFGRFQKQLKDFPADRLYFTIPDFHNTPKRFEDFAEAVKQDAVHRLGEAKEEADWLLSNRKLADVLQSRLNAGTLPLRVTHNDTKLNNVMIDDRTGKAICVIDLDTVMPGLSATDFGDANRVGARTAREDEKDLQKVHFDLKKYICYTEGFLEGTGGILTPEEYRMLPWGAIVITYEQALRFLGDYLKGDVYYKTDYPEHNLVRARTQIALLKEMLARIDQMTEIVFSMPGMAGGSR